MNRRAFISTAFASVVSASAQSGFRKRDSKLPPQVELIYTQGLRFLSDHQEDWTGENFYYLGVSGLGIMAFLAHGDDPERGKYAPLIKTALASILTAQDQASGYIGRSMYNHGFATLALAEAYGMVKSDGLARGLQKAVQLILKAQKVNPTGGWRYNPISTDADSTVSGAQIVALFAAKNAGFHVPDEAIEKGLAYLKSCRAKDGSYGYVSNASLGNPTLTAIGVLCLCLAKKRDDPGFKASVKYLKDNIEHREQSYPFYFEYYMSQALFHADLELWEQWNLQNIRYMSVIQSNDGGFLGGQGRVFSTAGALLSLALNYRLLPIYEK